MLNNKIAVFIEYYSIGNSPSIINLLDFLSENYKIDLFLRNVSLKNTDILKKKNIKIFELGRKRSLSYIIQKIRSKFIFYQNFICFDPHAFVLCKELFPASKPIYYVLELYLKNDHAGLYYPPVIKHKERKEINNIKGLIIQSEEKELLFRDDYNLSDKIPAFLLPVTYMGKSAKEKSQKIREKYNIDNNKKIALHLGGIAAWFSCIEIVKVFSELENWVLFFQGHSQKEYLEQLKNVIIDNNIKNVIISDEIYDSLEDVDEIIKSCDIGIAWYNDVSAVFRTVGKSSGKISAYLRFGLPTIAKKYPSTTDAIENTGCGICVDNFDEIKNAILKIENNYDEYSKNAILEYDKTYWFENYKKGLTDFLEKSG
ncbi:MAG: glycosyltransferase [bacterium]